MERESSQLILLDLKREGTEEGEGYAYVFRVMVVEKYRDLTFFRVTLNGTHKVP